MKMVHTVLTSCPSHPPLFSLSFFRTVTIDEKGVGKLIEMSAEQGRLGSKLAQRSSTSPARGVTFKAGVCGEHGGDPESVRYFARMGLQYVSCSAFRVPLARLAAAHAVIEEDEKRNDSKAV